MNKIKYLSLALLSASMMFTSCKDDAFGGDMTANGVELQEMCGTWCCTVEVNDPLMTTMYYVYDPTDGGYDCEFLNDYFGDPYGNYNPDANNDSVVDENDFALYTNEGMWDDFFGVGICEFDTSNSAANNTSEMVITDGFWGEAYKVNVDPKTMTFSAGRVVKYSYETESINKVTINNTYYNDEKPVVLGGKILKGAATAPGSGLKTDSIFFYVKYADDYGEDIYYKVSGYLKTGYTEDD